MSKTANTDRAPRYCNRALIFAGIDEAGRGPLAGPVFAAAVILDPKRRIKGLRDSKLLTPKERERLAFDIKERALGWAVASASVQEIDAINILQASLLAMSRAVGALSLVPQEVWVDGLHCPHVPMLARSIVEGDRTIAAIAAASILAKTTRDALLCDLDQQYPVYGFARHKGYATPEHLGALARHGPCPEHRRSFSPVVQLDLTFD